VRGQAARPLADAAQVRGALHSSDAALRRPPCGLGHPLTATDRAEPPLSDKEREVVKSYGGWTAFCESHGLKPWDPSDKQEALSIVKALASHD